MDVNQLSLTQLSENIRTRQISPVEVVEDSLSRLADVEPAITAFVTVTADIARKAAQTAEDEIVAGNYRGPLHGIPLAVKDLYDTRGVATTSSSAQRATYVPDTDAVTVSKLFDAGMILIGKTETHEFAYGTTTPQSGNPWDPTRTPGGSSGGSGAAVAAGVVHVALGSDTGGSIRIPASVCGTVGLKPTYGRTPRVGVASLSWSLDHVGPLTRNVIDAAMVTAAMSGYDRRDPASRNLGTPDFVSGADRGVRGFRIGIPTNFYTENVTAEATEAARNAANVLEGLGAHLVEVAVPYAAHILPTEWALVTPEATAYHMDATRTTPELFTDEVRMLIEIGEAVPAVDYINALRLRTLIQRGWQRMFDKIDVLLAPTVPGVAAPRSAPFFEWPDGTVESATGAYSRLSAPANVTGLPSLQVPAAFTSAGLPLGVQLIGRPFAEADLIRVGVSLEGATDVVGRIAPVTSAVAP